MNTLPVIDVPGARKIAGKAATALEKLSHATALVADTMVASACSDDDAVNAHNLLLQSIALLKKVKDMT